MNRIKSLNSLSTMAYAKLFRRKQEEVLPATYKRVRSALRQQLNITNNILLETQNINQTIARIDVNMMKEPIDIMLRDVHSRVGVKFGKLVKDVIQKADINPKWLNSYFEGIIYQLSQRGAQIADTSLQGLTATLLRAGQEDLSIPATSRLLRTEFSRLSPSRATRIARTEVVSASNRGSLTSAKLEAEELEVDMKKRWLATSDSRTRDAHITASGQVRELNEPFNVRGEALMYPGDSVGSAGNVINCRCAIVYTFPGDEDFDN